MQKELAGRRESLEKFVSLAILLHGKHCSQFLYTDFHQLRLESDPNEEGNTVEVPLTISWAIAQLNNHGNYKY